MEQKRAYLETFFLSLSVGYPLHASEVLTFKLETPYILNVYIHLISSLTKPSYL